MSVASSQSFDVARASVNTAKATLANERVTLYGLTLVPRRRALAIGAGLAALAVWPWVAPRYFVFLASVILVNVVVAIGLIALSARVPLSGYTVGDSKQDSPFLMGVFRLEKAVGVGDGSLAIALAAAALACLAVGAALRNRLAWVAVGATLVASCAVSVGAISFDHRVADGADQLRHVIRAHVQHGVDVIKVAASGGVFSRGDTPGAPQFTYEELRVAAEEGFEPDGDSMQFKPSNPALLGGLARTGAPARLTSIGSTQLRFEGIDGAAHVFLNGEEVGEHDSAEDRGQRRRDDHRRRDHPGVRRRHRRHQLRLPSQKGRKRRGGGFAAPGPSAT